MLEHRYDIRISESYVDSNPLMVEIQDPDNFTRFQTRERCALEKAAYVFNSTSRYWDYLLDIDNPFFEQMVGQIYSAESQLNKANSSDTEAPF